MYKNQLVKKNQSLKDAGIQHATRLYALIDDIEDSKFQRTSGNVIESQQSLQEEFVAPAKRIAREPKDYNVAPAFLMPKPPKDGYKTSPSMDELKKMSAD